MDVKNVVNKIFKHKYLTPELLIPIIEAIDSFLPRDDLWYLLKKEVYGEVPRTSSAPARLLRNGAVRRSGF